MYVPVLKGKPGEFLAWRNASGDVVAGCRPVFEVVPNRGELRDLTDFVRQVAVGWPADAVLTVDTGALDQAAPIEGTADRAVAWTSRALLDRGVPARPVLRLDDDPSVLAEVAAAVALHGRGACLRLGSEEEDPDPGAAAALAPSALDAAGLDPADVDLLIDLRQVSSSRDVARTAPVALAVLSWASASGPWRSVALVVGAFPASISQLPTCASSPVRRYDADLYDAVLSGGPAVVPHYGDYGVAHPAVPTPVRQGPLPNLRYCSGEEWQVFRERRDLPGNDSFFTLCGRVRSSAYWAGAGYSWGDGEVDRCADASGGAGTATQWRAYGTSHHLAQVTDRLASLGAP